MDKFCEKKPNFSGSAHFRGKTTKSRSSAEKFCRSQKTVVPTWVYVHMIRYNCSMQCSTKQFQWVPMRTISIHGRDKTTSVSENGRPPYRNFTSDFDSDLCLVHGLWFCFSLPNFIVIRRGYDVISIFKDGGHGVGNLLRGSGLMMAPV